MFLAGKNIAYNLQFINFLTASHLIQNMLKFKSLKTVTITLITCVFYIKNTCGGTENLSHFSGMFME